MCLLYSCAKVQTLLVPATHTQHYQRRKNKVWK